MNCHRCQKSIEDEDGFYAVHPVGLPTRRFHDECYLARYGTGQVDYWPPKAAFPTDEELQREDVKGDRI